jgi:AcrR family transcriptional regulator
MAQRRPGRPVDHENTERKRLLLLEATKAVLVENGLTGLTIDAVAARAGEYNGSVRYYFESKAGLVAALVDYLAPEVLEEQSALPEDERGRAALDAWRDFWLNRDNAVAFVEILPLVVRDPSLRAQMAARYREYASLDSQFLEFVGESDPRRLRSLSVLISAVIDGVGQQHLLDPEGVDIDAAFGMFAELVEAYADANRRRRR